MGIEIAVFVKYVNTVPFLSKTYFSAFINRISRTAPRFTFWRFIE